MPLPLPHDFVQREIMTRIRVEEVNNTTEELLLAGMISNSAYLAWVRDRYKPNYIRNEQMGLLIGLVIEHFDLHGEAPGETTRELFESIIDHISEEDVAICKQLLKKISEKYSGREISFEILSDTTTDYFEVRSVEVLVDKLSGLSKRGKTDEAMQEVHAWVEDPKGVQVGAISPFDESFAQAILAAQTPLFRFGNDLDRVFPLQMKNKFYTFVGGTKSGKSQWLGWLSTVFLEHGLKVVIWEYELTQIEFLHRTLSAITGKFIDSYIDSATVSTDISIFDCEKNRNGTCENPDCPEQNADVDFNLYEEGIWIPCTACRGTDLFSPVIWKEPHDIGVINKVSELKKEQLRWKRQVGDNIRIFNRDPSTQEVKDLTNELDRLRIVEGFIPDAIVVDSADNIKPSKIYSDKRHELGNVWSELSVLAKHGYLLWTASQTNRTGWNKEWITTDMIGEDASKLMIADGTMLINQWKSDTMDEYYWDTQRLRAAYFRGQKMPGYDLKVIHDFSRYIACLDCVKFR